MSHAVRLRFALLITALFLAATSAAAIVSHPPFSAPARVAPLRANIANSQAAPIPAMDEQASND
jgi:hypothetical protein